MWHLAGGAKLKASDSPVLLPRGFTDRAAIHPESMLVAAASSAHMLSWLNVAFGMGIEGVSDLDQAHGVLREINRPDELWVSEVILHLRIAFDPHFEISAEVVARVHELAHEHCLSRAQSKRRSRCARGRSENRIGS
ncbi:MAG: OsmC family protein [Steroidobacteraceae bacterium]